MGPSHDDWEAKKPVLLDTWFGKRSLNSLMDYMKNEHQFIASKNQYERKFGEWGWRKNLTDAEIRYVASQVEARRASGKKSHVTLTAGGFEISIPQERIRKRKYRPADVRDEASSERVRTVAFPGLRISTPPPNPEQVSRAKYKHPDGSEIFSSSLNSFAARGRSSKKQCLRKRTPDGSVVVNTSGLPYVDLLKLMDQLKLKGMFLKSLSAASGSATTRRLLHDHDRDISHNDDLLNLVRKTPGLSRHVGRTAVMLIFGIFCSSLTRKQLFSRQLSMKMDVRHTILERLQSSFLERDDGDLNKRLDRLIGPISHNDSFFEALTMAIQLGSNGMLWMESYRDILVWLGNQQMELLEMLFEIKIASVRSFLDELFNKTCLDTIQFFEHHGGVYTPLSRREPIAFERLLLADKHHKLFGGNKVAKVVVALRVNCIRVIELLLQDGVSPDATYEKDIHNPPTPLLAFAGTSRALEFLLQKEANANVNFQCNLHGTGRNIPMTALVLASYKGRNDLVTCLLKAGAMPVPVNPILSSLEHPKENIPNFQPVETRNPEVYLTLRKADLDVQFVPQWDEIRRRAWQDDESFVDRHLTVYNAANTTAKSFTLSPEWIKVFENAIISNSVRVAVLLLEAGIDVNTKLTGYRHLGESAIEIARVCEYQELESQLLRYGADPEPSVGLLIKGALEEGCLLPMALEGRFTLEELLDAAFQLHTQPHIGENGRRALDLLAVVRHFHNIIHAEIAPQLQQRVLKLAIQLGQLEYATSLVQSGTCLKLLGNEPTTFLQLATEPQHTGRGTPDLVKQMLQRGALDLEPEAQNSKGYQALINTLEDLKGLETAKILLEAGVNVDPQLLSHNALELTDYLTPLQVLVNSCRGSRDAQEEEFELVRLLISKGAEIDAISTHYDLWENGTPLQLAVISNNPALVSLLIELGADINAPPSPKFGRTAIQAAVSAEIPDQELVNMLLQKGADVHAPAAKEWGRTSLQGAAGESNIKLVKLLLEMGVDVNAPGSQIGGGTALKLAAIEGHLDTVVLLLNNGAIPTEEAASWAEVRNHFVIAEIIRERMAVSQSIH